MYIGSLAKVMGIHEDSQSAYKSRVKNRAYRDPNTTVATTFKGSMADMNKQVAKMMPPKDARKFNKYLQTTRDKAITQQMKRDEETGENKDHHGDREWYENEHDRILNLPTNMSAGYHNKANVIGVNEYLHNGALDKNGNIDPNSRVMRHEKQHEVQAKIKSEYAKDKGRNHQNKIRSDAERQEDKLNTTMEKYTQDEIPNMLHYKSLPHEFDANAAAYRGYNSAGKGTIRASLQNVKRWPGREFRPKNSHANNMYDAGLNGKQHPPSQRAAEEKRIPMQLPVRYQQNYLNAPNKPSTTPLPAKTQEFINKTSEKINKQIENGRTFTNKDLENAQPLRQNPIPRKQR